MTNPPDTTGKSERLIELLADKTLSFGLWYRDSQFDYCVVAGVEENRVYSFSNMGDKHSWPLPCHPIDQSFKDRKKYKIHTKEDLKDYKILGHPVTLARVLLNLQIGDLPNFCETNLSAWTHELCKLWDCNQDDITLQSPETIDFLYNLFFHD